MSPHLLQMKFKLTYEHANAICEFVDKFSNAGSWNHVNKIVPKIGQIVLAYGRKLENQNGDFDLLFAHFDPRQGWIEKLHLSHLFITYCKELPELPSDI